ncbi:DUF6010 family protein [Streptomyces sp. NPDC059467]|uniref:DUF6010 family protein n=1 Tax=Streptomyces sp. NPDC059467 TaxID=3346844 RepID=UPI003678C89A
MPGHRGPKAGARGSGRCPIRGGGDGGGNPAEPVGAGAAYIKGSPLIPFFLDSSFGCAICDPVIALWCFLGGVSVWRIDEFRRPLRSTSRRLRPNRQEAPE